ncbi:glycosyltransferase family 4 protein [Streptomyces sp. NPDC019396]|uniref:glycosyltransferase family 4 protein n=1 Tax=Streptomyces sp. NPDC019396 TaxID=3154687 RepID=UPI0033C25E13
MKISFLLHHAYGVGGTIRTVFNLAEALAARHEVEIASVFRYREKTQFALGSQVCLVPLVDMRPGEGTDRSLLEHPARSYPASDGRYMQHSHLTEKRIKEWLAGNQADIVVGTRPGLNALLARFTPEHIVRIGQEHQTHDGHRFALRTQLRNCYPQLDALVTVTEADAKRYRKSMPRVRVASIPNSVPAPTIVSQSTEPIVIAAGRLVPVKKFDQLIDAFAEVAKERPDWQLRIYGDGPERKVLQARIGYHGLKSHVKLMGSYTPMDSQWPEGSIAAVNSRSESFGMTIVEAMRSGLPVVSTDCPLGPAEIIHHGTDGLLVPVGDSTAMARALLGLINDAPKRRQMARAARENAQRFDPGHIAAQYEELFDELLLARKEMHGNFMTRALSTARTNWSYVATEFLFRFAIRIIKAVRPE